MDVIRIFRMYTARQISGGWHDEDISKKSLPAERFGCEGPCKINLVILSLLCFFCTADDLCFSVCRQAVEWKCREPVVYLLFMLAATLVMYLVINYNYKTTYDEPTRNLQI